MSEPDADHSASHPRDPRSAPGARASDSSSVPWPRSYSADPSTSGQWLRSQRALSSETLDALHRAGFDLEEPVAAGGFGVVYSALDRRLGRRVAIKVIDRISRRDQRAGVLPREIEALATFRHPHIVPLFAAGELAAGPRYLVMPWLEGTSLRKRLRSHGPLPLREVLRLGIDLADALAALHAQGLVHRDIKPENVMTDGRHATIIDFGLVCAVRPADRVGDADDSGEHLVGTPAYMSPEQWEQGGAIDGRADVYSLGCLLFELLSGRSPNEPPAVSPLVVRPRDRFRWSQTLNSTDALDPTIRYTPRSVPHVREARPEVPAALDRLLRRAMATNPAHRVSSALEFRDALARVQVAVLSGDEGRRTRRTILLAAAAIIVLVPWLVIRQFDSVQQERLAALSPQRVLVTTVHNATGDATLDPLVEMVSTQVQDALSRRLAETAGDIVREVLVVRGEGAAVTGPGREDPIQAAQPLALARGTGTVVSMEVTRVNDQLALGGVVIDARRGTSTARITPTMVPAEATDAQIARMTDSLAASIARTLRASGPPPGNEELNGPL